MAAWAYQTNIKGPPGSSDWEDITGKPDTFPPTLPLTLADISDDGTAAKLNIHVGPTPPPGTPGTGDIWIDTS